VRKLLIQSQFDSSLASFRCRGLYGQGGDVRQGASLEDPTGIFNSSLDGNLRRAIDVYEADKIDEKAFKALVRAAVELNASPPAAARKARAPKQSKKLKRPLQLALVSPRRPEDDDHA
jgi:hypothetical protein